MQDEKKDPFERIMEIIGYDGRFQKMYTFLFVMGLTFCGALIYMNIILALNPPDHWCFIAGMNESNLTLDEWRTLNLPIKVDNRGDSKFSSCTMYNFSNYTVNKLNVTTFEEITCQNGYEYDKTWYDETIPMRENWVCERDLYMTNTFVVSRFTEMIGSFLFGQLGDIYGRQVVYNLSVAITFLGRAISIFTTSSYIIFITATAVAALTMNSLFQSPLIIAMEISTDDERTNIAMFQSLGWSIATSLMPLLFWYLRNWVSFMWLTTIPTILLLLFYRYMIESPRWLISKKRFGDALKQFKVIARVNNRKLEITEDELAKLFVNVKEEQVYGLASLFATWRLAKNTIIMGFSWCVVAVSYFTLVLFSSQMGGNPFLNFLLQSVVEIPAYVLGKYLGDTIGRRLTNSLSFVVSAVTCIPIIILSTESKYEFYIVILSAFIKFLNGLTFFAASLQSMEIYPTCLRQTGIGLGTILANGVGILAPYFVYIGTTYDIRYPYYILTTLFLIGGIAATFLPETLHQKLPDTLEDAKIFGREQLYWSLPKSRKISTVTKAELELLNANLEYKTT